MPPATCCPPPSRSSTARRCIFTRGRRRSRPKSGCWAAPRVLRPGGTAYARLVLREPALLLPGDRFIIRMFSPVVTIGGGVVVDLGERPLRPGRGRRRAAGRAGLRRRGRAPGAAGARSRVRHGNRGTGGTHRYDGGRDRRRGRPAPTWFRSRSRSRGTWIGPGSRPRANGWRRPCANFTAGIRCSRVSPRQDLRNRELPGCPAFLLDALLAARRRDCGRRRDWCARAATGRCSRRMRSRRAPRSSALSKPPAWPTPAWREVLAKSGVEPARARTLLEMLLREKRLVRVNEDLVFHRSAIERLRGMLAARSRSASAFRSSRNGPASRANMPFRCSNTWTASASRGARAHERVVL